MSKKHKNTGPATKDNPYHSILYLPETKQFRVANVNRERYVEYVRYDTLEEAIAARDANTASKREAE